MIKSRNVLSQQFSNKHKPENNIYRDTKNFSEFRNLMLDFLDENNANTKILKEYWKFLEDTKNEAETQSKEKNRTEQKMLNDLDEAETYIEELIDNQIYPIVSVPKEYLPVIEKNSGISAHETDIKGVSLIAGVIGDLPYKYEDSNRIFFQIKCSAQELKPRLTGRDDYFGGVVVWQRNHISKNNMKEIKKSDLFSKAA